MSATVLLISSDQQLHESAATALESVSGCSLSIKTSSGDLSFAADNTTATLLLFHVACREDEERLGKAYQLACNAGRPATVLAICDHFNPAQAVRLFQLGATDCLSRPLDLRRLAMLIDVLTLRSRFAAALHGKVAAPNARLDSADSYLYTPDDEKTLIEQVRAVAPLPTTVLLEGETGTGKTRLARLMHELSPRRNEPFVVVNCGALSPSLVASELFGHVKGAFTGADSDRQGKFKQAGAGTLVLDDIDGLPLAVQSKLLRVLDERTFERLGSDQTEALRARIIVATNRILEKEVAAGAFRHDLYFRIHVVAIKVAPLRERPALIKPLIDHYLADLARKHGRSKVTVTQSAVHAMHAYQWPGNIRELQNVIERALALTPCRPIELDDLPDAIRHAAPEVAPRPSSAGGSRWLEHKAEEERRVIRRALAVTGNNRLRAAQELGMSRATLYKKLRQHGI